MCDWSWRWDIEIYSFCLLHAGFVIPVEHSIKDIWQEIIDISLDLRHQIMIDDINALIYVKPLRAMLKQHGSQTSEIKILVVVYNNS